MNRLFLDCDGVLADFDRGAAAVLGLPPREFEKRHGLGEFWRRLARAPDFYATVPPLPDETPRTAQTIAFLGQPVYGHQAPNGYPETGEAWMNAGAILNRINFGIGAATGRLPGATVSAIPGVDSLRTASREAQVDAIARLLLGGNISTETRTVLISGQNPLLGQTEATRLDGIAQVVGLALGSPEFQRR